MISFEIKKDKRALVRVVFGSAEDDLVLFISAGNLIIRTMLRAILEIQEENKSSAVPVEIKGPLLGFVRVFKFAPGGR